MNVAFEIAKRIAFNKQRSFSKFIIRLSVTATAVSVIAMIVTLAFVNGFQQTVSQKVFSFWGHIRVQHFEAGKSLVAEESPIAANDTVERILTMQYHVMQVQPFATKSAVIQNKKEIGGILFKGVDSNYNGAQLQRFIVEGKWLSFNDSLYSHEIILSAPIAKQLLLHTGDTLAIYFISRGESASSFRKLKVAGIYKTGIEEYDNLFAIGDIRLIRRINGWQPNEIGGYEVFVKDYKEMDTTSAQFLERLPALWTSKTVREVYPNIFDWLNILDMNRNVVFIVMAIVAIINLVTCLLILVLERTRMVGVLKAIGAEDGMIRNIFIYYASLITLAGVGIGAIAGVGLCLLQQATGLIKLDESNYYVSVAPIQIIWWQVAAVCIATAVICFLSLIIPTLIVKKIQPVKAIEFR